MATPVTCQLNVDNAPNRSAGQLVFLGRAAQDSAWGFSVPVFSAASCQPYDAPKVDTGFMSDAKNFLKGSGRAATGKAQPQSCAKLGARAILPLCIATLFWTIFRTRAMWALSMEPRLQLPWRIRYAETFWNCRREWMRGELPRRDFGRADA